MAKVNFRRTQKQSGPSSLLSLLCATVVTMLLLFRMHEQSTDASRGLSTTRAYSVRKEEKNDLLALVGATKMAMTYSEDPACLDLPVIRPSGVFFVDSRIRRARNPDSVEPHYYIGSIFRPGAVKKHMGADLAHYKLITEHFQNNRKNNKRLALDIGANQGFFTYFLAASGFQQVHSFEIGKDNFEALQHGRHFNSKEVADRVFLYPMGLSSKVGRIGIQGKDYGGFLAESDNGPIQSVTLDCFAHHTAASSYSGVSLLSNGVDFVKLDTEGFEIDVIKGGLGTLFQSGGAPIGAMLVEVGPARWTRAGTEFADGLSILQNTLADSLFGESFVIIRYPKNGKGGDTCPPSLEDLLSDKNPKVLIETAKMFKVQPMEWEPLLSNMKENDFDCNFWFAN